MTKKLILLLMLVTLLIAFFSSASLAAEIKIIFNGTEMKLDQDPIMENGRVLVPFRHIFQAMNMKVDYNFETQEIKAGRGGAVLIELQVDNRYAQVRGEQKILDVAPRLIAKTSRTVVPLRFVTENAGAQVDWDDKTQTVTITYKAAANIYELMENHHPVYTNKGLTIDLSQDMAFFEQGNANIVEYRISTDHKLAEALLDLDQLRWLAQEFVKTVYEIVGNLPDPDAFALIRLYVT
ncbi:MAG: copper amine oxidase N-terminal domain-containing protein, partial [Clostridiales bacterium]|nr:copper amine oxidase N-terminal domain-containing protein [Clostridiales bacterium]